MLKILTALYTKNLHKKEKKWYVIFVLHVPFCQEVGNEETQSTRHTFSQKHPEIASAPMHIHNHRFSHSFKVKKGCSVVPLYVHIYGWK